MIVSKFLLLICLAYGIHVSGQSFSLGEIPPELMVGANAVVRQHSTVLELSDINTGILKTTRVVTVLNAKGASEANVHLFYDKNQKIKVNECRLHNAFGGIAQKINVKDFIDIPVSDGISIYTDNRAKVYETQLGDFPYTLYCEYEIKMDNIISYANWFPIESTTGTVEKADYTIIAPKDVKFKFKSDFKHTYSTSENNKKFIHSWVFQKIKVGESNQYDHRIGFLNVMPEVFEYEGKSGSSNDWQKFGLWFEKLFKERRDLSPIKPNYPLNQQSKELVRKLYQEMQKNTRYVSVQLGLGGFQPFHASSVLKEGYGDCKALVNYLCAKLAQYGLTSYPALVFAGKNKKPILWDYPHFGQFNHVILCVPLNKDTVWLECTSQTLPFGFLGDFTDNRDVLLLKESGGEWARTPAYSKEQNKRITKATVDITINRDACINANFTFRGLQYDEFSFLKFVQKTDRQRVLSSFGKLNNPIFGTMSVQLIDAPFMCIGAEMKVKNYVTEIGNEVLLPINPISCEIDLPKPERMAELSKNGSFRPAVFSDSITINLPTEWRLAKLPEGKPYQCKFGKFESKLEIQGKSLIYTRRLEVEIDELSSDEKEKYEEFFLFVTKESGMKVFLEKVK